MEIVDFGVPPFSVENKDNDGSQHVYKNKPGVLKTLLKVGTCGFQAQCSH